MAMEAVVVEDVYTNLAIRLSLMMGESWTN